MGNIDLADAKSRLDELVARVASGETVCITCGGEPVARLTAARAPRRPVDVDALRALTESMPLQTEAAGDFVRAMRDGDRY